VAKIDQIKVITGPENISASAGGIFLQRLDNKSRIFVNAQMRPYFMQDELDTVFCWVGYPQDLETPCLIITNDAVHNEIGESINENQLLNFNKLDLLDLGTVYSGFSLFRRVDIKSNRIQLNHNDRKLLNLPDNDKRIVIAGFGNTYHVWPFEIFSSKNKKIAEFLTEE
jgi:DNA-binding transcriptional regulator/RsmH inhibitor MraZ